MFMFSITNAQEQTKTAGSPVIQTDQTSQKKAQNNNTVRSNRTEVKAAIDQPNSGAQSKSQDHNSSRIYRNTGIINLKGRNKI